MHYPRTSPQSTRQISGTTSTLARDIFLSHKPEVDQPEIKPIGVGASAAQIVSNLLNGLAHTGAGLDGAIQIAHTTACFNLRATDLYKTCMAVRTAIKTLNVIQD